MTGNGQHIDAGKMTPPSTYMLFTLLCSACQLIAHASQDNTMIQLNQSIWRLVEHIQTQPSLTLPNVEQQLAQSLVQDARHSNEYFKFYTGKQIQLAGDITVTGIDLRLPQQGAQSQGMLLLQLGGACINMPQLTQQHQDLKITNTPRGGSLEESTTYTASKAWGEIDFGFQEKKPDCLAYVILKPAK